MHINFPFSLSLPPRWPKRTCASDGGKITVATRIRTRRWPGEPDRASVESMTGHRGRDEHDCDGIMSFFSPLWVWLFASGFLQADGERRATAMGSQGRWQGKVETWVFLSSLGLGFCFSICCFFFFFSVGCRPDDDRLLLKFDTGAVIFFAAALGS